MLAERPALRAQPSFAGVQVLVVGDVMLDEYIWGHVQRISPEAPVPIVHIDRRTYSVGGAANVAANVSGLGGNVFLCGIVGDDVPAAMLRAALHERGVGAENLIIDASRPTTTKTRVIAHSQQVVRVDAESRTQLPDEIEDALVRQMETLLPTVQACILSDYEKGVVSPRLAQSVIRLARRHEKPVIVDPKGTDFAKYRGATVVTPNLHEVARATNREIGGDADLSLASRQLADVLGDTAVLVTRGPQGMSLFVRGAITLDIPTVARNVFDVTGAGDTVVSTLALSLAAGMTLVDAARLANVAAGIVVGKIGAATVTPDELLDGPTSGNVPWHGNALAIGR